MAALWQNLCFSAYCFIDFYSARPDAFECSGRVRFASAWTSGTKEEVKKRIIKLLEPMITKKEGFQPSFL